MTTVDGTDEPYGGQRIENYKQFIREQTKTRTKTRFDISASGIGLT